MQKKLMMVMCGTALLASTISRAANTGEDAQLKTLVVHGDRMYAPQTTSTVTRSPLPLQDTPIAVQIVNDDVIQDQKINSLTDALRNVSGVQPRFYLGGSYERFVIRGFSQSLSAYRNGVQLPFPRFHAANTERVEVLKGPAALEYGMSDPGGIINIVTRKPSAQTQARFEQSFSSLDDYRTTLGINGALNESGTVAARVDASYLNANGFRELTDTEESFVAPSIAWTIDNTTIRLSTEFEKSRRIYDGGLPAIGDDLIDVSRERSYNQKGMHDDYDNRLIDLNVEHRFNKEWKLTAGYSDYNTNTYYRSFYLSPNDNGTAERFAWYGPEDYTTRTAWLQINGELHTGNVKHLLSSGVQYSTLDGDASASDSYVDTIDLYQYRYGQSHVDLAQFSTSPTNNFIVKQDDKALGVFVQDQLIINERLIAQLGVRYDSVKRDLKSEYGSDIIVSDIVPNHSNDTQFSPRAGLLYKLTSQFSVYASYAESFGPAFNYEPSALYDPETAKQYEVGFKAALLNNNLTATVAVFDLTKQNIPTPHPTQPNVTVAIGEARSRGLEIDVQGALTQNLSLIANYSYLDTEITKDFGGTEGNHLPSAPRHQGAAWLRYSTDKILPGLSFGGGAFASSSRFGDTANSYSDEGYARWDAFAAYRFKLSDSAVTAQINILNITDEDYYTMRARWSNMPSEPRSVVGSLSVEF